ncbi:MAG: helix-turn-helix domain-containing protein [Halobacteriales archaeon]
MIDISMDMRQYDCPFIDTTDDYAVSFSAAHWEFDQSTRELETRMVVQADDRDTLEAGLFALRDHDHMREYQLLSKRGGQAQIRTTIDETNAMQTIRRNDGFVTGPFHIEDGTELWHVGFDDDTVADDALAELEQENDFTVESREAVAVPELQSFVQNVGSAMTLIEGCRELSDAERQTLETAVAEGYFETPREATLGTLADEFDVSKPAVSKNLRRGQQKLFERAVDVLQPEE